MKDISIVLCGKAGQGIQTVEKILVSILKLSGYFAFSAREFMSRIRGGSNSTEIRVSDEPVDSFVEKIDILIPLDDKAVDHVKWRIDKNTIMLGGKEFIEGKAKKTFEIPFIELAKEAGNKLYANTVTVGVLSGMLDVDFDIVEDFIRDYFKKKDEKIVEGNIEAAKKGYEIGKDLAEKNGIGFDLRKDKRVKEQLLLSGTELVSLGAIAGGCNFISSYPMSPSTGVLVFLSQQQEEFGIIAEQAESEICAINMSLGAFYAGARAMVTTSGGGFALMNEGLSLAGMLETPIVIHLAQRPGPATGLPTRSEQGDLLFALFAGHGEFPRIILTPGKAEDVFNLARKAFELADKFQVPVIIMTDQYLLDSSFVVSSLDISKSKNKEHIVKTDEDYKRYEVTKDGISPRGIPGYGKGFVVVDSDEHDEEGHITEDLDFRTEIVDKRLRKSDSIKKEIETPELIGNKDYETLVIGWGSTYYGIKEALKRLDDKKLSFLYYKQVYPLYPDTRKYIERAKKTIVVENNATGQFARLIKMETGIQVDHSILKYNGLPFGVEEIVKRLKDTEKKEGK
ncbi:MAG: 2-oxoacid:acceptor oxidoreductase subunit alpha [candidate division WOR-3 bacterium]